MFDPMTQHTLILINLVANAAAIFLAYQSIRHKDR